MLVVDGVLILASMLAAYWAHVGLRLITPLVKAPPPLEVCATLAFFALPLWLVLIAYFGLHRGLEHVYSRRELLVGLFKLHASGVVGLSVMLFLTQEVINRSLVLAFLSFTFSLMYLKQGLLSTWLRYQHQRGHGRRHILLIGDPGEAMQQFVAAAAASSLPPQFEGRLATAAETNSSDDDSDLPPRCGLIGDLDKFLHEQPIDQVVFFPPVSGPRDAGEALEVCETHGVAASFALDMSQLHDARPRLQRLHDNNFICFEVVPKDPTRLALKHAIDFVGAFIAVVILAPIFLLAALTILLSMGRPIFFAQERAGRCGRVFQVLKFRSMVAGAAKQQQDLEASNETDGPTFKMTGDPRVTRLGRFLRRTSIDELPQLINVLRGTMSLVGPRPLPVDQQQKIRGWHRRRLSMKPGITCLWQVGGRSNIGFEEWMKLDLRYVDQWSLWLDFKILLRTIPAVISGKGAR
jgi:exopolysaccharide biosynthesis polyprenyl glycosylphosphotransferase